MRLAHALVLCALGLAGCGSPLAFTPLMRARLRPPSHPLVATPTGALAPSPSVPEPALLGADFPSVEAATLASGLTVRVVRIEGATTVGAELGMRGGDVTLPPMHARLLEHALRETQGASPEIVVTPEVSRRGARLRACEDRARLEAMLDAIAGVALARVDRTRERAVQRVLDDRATGSVRRARVEASLAALLYGVEDPRALPPTGSASLPAGADLDTVWRRTAVPGASILVLTGDITLGDVLAATQRVFDGWSGSSGTSGASTSVDAPRRATPTSRAMVLEAGGTMCRTFVAEVGPAPTDIDFPAFVALGEHLAGEAGSGRLTTRLREEFGVAYAVWGDLKVEADHSRFEATIVSHCSDLRIVVDAIVDELAAAASRERISEVDVVRARRGAHARLLESLATTHDAAALFADIFSIGLEPDWLAEYDRELARLTVDTFVAAGARWLRPDAAPLVIVGPSTDIRLALGETVPGGIRYPEESE